MIEPLYLTKSLYEFSRTYSGKFLPTFVRHYITIEGQSSIIESYLQKNPRPSAILIKEISGQFTIIDGQKTINSIVNFYSNRLHLTGLKLRHDLNGLTYSKLPLVDQSILDNYKMKLTVIKRQDKEYLTPSQIKELLCTTSN